MRYAHHAEVLQPAAHVVSWPANSRLPVHPGRQTLVVFLHPKCPCSRATIAELKRLLTGDGAAQAPAPAVVIAAVTPPGADESWTKAPNIERALTLPGSAVYVDRGGVEAQRFGAVDSGTVVLFDADGRRRYSGGVTAARGHEGPSAGGSSLAAALAGGFRTPVTCPAFGCRLVAPERKFDVATAPLVTTLTGSTANHRP